MRIAHIDTGREMRGGQWQVLYLLQGLAAAGHELILFARPDAPLFEKARQFDVRPVGLRAIRGMRADLVHVHDARAHMLAALAGCRPLVVSRRVAFPLQTNPLSRWKYGKAAHFIAVSEHVRKVMAASGIAEERISVVYDGVPIPPEPALRSGAQIVTPATDDPRKGSGLVREAAALANVDVRFSTDLAHDLRDAAAFVYITYEEGLGSGALLAMAAGVPVIASRVGGLTEIITDGETGVLVENTARMIGAAMTRVLRDPALAGELAAAGRRRVRENFSAAGMVRKTLAVYDRVLAC
jgi:glycosyltransferase involved in cell wall biosynthesis